jgi:hypothetical protein
VERINGGTVLIALCEHGPLICVRTGKYLGFVVYRLNGRVRYSFGQELLLMTVEIERLEKLKRK